MKRLFISCLLAVVAIMSLVSSKVDVEPIPKHIPAVTPKKITPKKKALPRKDLRAFLHKMAMRESDNTPTAVNKFGMMGKYQFHPSTVKVLGFKVEKEDFLANPALQDKVMVAYLKANRRELRPVIRQFAGKVVNGVRITESGILAGAHFSGSTGVLAFFYPDRYIGKMSDANGTHITEYMKLFAGYTLF